MLWLCLSLIEAIEVDAAGGQISRAVNQKPVGSVQEGVTRVCLPILERCRRRCNLGVPISQDRVE